jgi:hypothetical protein
MTYAPSSFRGVFPNLADVQLNISYRNFDRTSRKFVLKYRATRASSTLLFLFLYDVEDHVHTISLTLGELYDAAPEYVKQQILEQVI